MKNNVNELDKYFLSQKQAISYIKHSFEMEQKGNGFRFSPHVFKNASISRTILTKGGYRMDDNFIMYIDCDENTFKFDRTNKKAIEIYENYK